MKKLKIPFNTREQNLVNRLTTPAKIQDFLNKLPINFEHQGDTCRSPREVLKAKEAHCLEGAMFAAAVLWQHGHPPLLLDLKSSTQDYDHVVALFKQNGKWGAISKTNHAILRYREPVYNTIRELALSYFHEYFNDKGLKTLRSFSRPFSLKRYGAGWITSPDNLWDIGADLDDSFHTPIISPAQARGLRKADPLEIKAITLTDY
jgi:hypothetical protein